MRATEILRNEHRVIEQVLSSMERMTQEFLRAGAIERGPAEAALDFIRTFADRGHHAKEEDRLFPALEANGFPRGGGPTGVMLAEHEQGRALVRAMAGAVEERKLTEFAKAFLEFNRHLRAHIQKEDHCLFPMADSALSEAAHVALVQDFARDEADRLGAGERARCLGIADALAVRYGAAPQAEGGCGGGARGCGCGGG